MNESRLFREALAGLLGQQSDISVVEAAATIDGTLSQIREHQPEILLFQIAIPTGIQAIRTVSEAAPQCRVVMLGVSETEEEVIACAEAGAAGYVARDGSLDDLIGTIHSVACGETRCSPRMAATLFKRVAVLAAERQAGRVSVHLTRREREIVHLIDAGLSNKEIAAHLAIGVWTVKNHVHNILEKLQVHRRGEAAARMRTSSAFVTGLARMIPLTLLGNAIWASPFGL